MIKKIGQQIQQIKHQPTVRVFLTHFKRANTGQAAPMLAYYGLLALFPAIIAIGAMLPYIGLTVDTAINFVKQVVPSNINSVLIPLIRNVLGKQSVSLFSVGLLVTLWSLSVVIANFRNCVDKIYGVKKGRSTWLVRLISMGGILLLLLAQVVLMFFVAVSRPLLNTLVQLVPGTQNIITLIERAQWPVTIVLLLIGVSLLNYALLPKKGVQLKPLLIGSGLEVVAFLALTKLFGVYVSIAASRYSVYQAIGSIIILLIWLNLVATIALLGVVMIASLTKLNDIKLGEQPLPRPIIKRWHLPRKNLNGVNEHTDGTK